MVYVYYVLNGQESEGEIMKNFKKITAAALAAAMLGAAVPVAGMLSEPLGVTANAAGTLTEGDYSYTVNKDGETVTITKYNGTNTTVVIPGTLGGKAVTMIGNRAFESCTSLTSVTIPDSVTAIDSVAFAGCNRLTSITIPDGVTEIADAAFNGCIRLTSVTIPNSVTAIGSDAFGFCTSLTSIAIPDSVTAINYAAFHDCYALTSVTIPSSVTEIGARAFHQCTSLTSVIIPNGVTNIGTSAFNSCTSITSVNYSGTKAKWEAVTIGSSNECLTSAEIICTDGIINERKPDTSDSATSDPTTSTGVPGDTAGVPGETGTPDSSDKQETIAATLKNVDSKDGLSGAALEKQIFGDSGWTWAQVEKIEFTSDKLFSVRYTAVDGSAKTLGEKTDARAADDGIWNTAWTLDTSLMSKDKPSVTLLAKDGTADITAKVYIKKNAEKPSNSDQKSTGIALATAPAVLAASAVIAVSKKRK